MLIVLVSKIENKVNSQWLSLLSGTEEKLAAIEKPTPHAEASTTVAICITGVESSIREPQPAHP